MSTSTPSSEGRLDALSPLKVLARGYSVTRKGDRVVVRVEDTFLGDFVDMEADLVVLAVGMVPRPETGDLSRLLKLSNSADGFLLEAHPKLRPVETAMDGIFLAGACQGPKDIPDTVAQAKGAAAEALALSASGEVAVAPMISSIDPDICVGCQVCIGLCAYSAIEFNEFKGVSEVNEAVCKGCGSCSAHCPSGAAKVRHFTDNQIFEEIDGLLAG